MSHPGSEDKPAIGLVVNPIAGLGGPAGLKGSDGPSIQHAALERGATPQANDRALRMLSRLAGIASERFRVLTAQGHMGEYAALQAGLDPQIVHRPSSVSASDLFGTTHQDTRHAVQKFRDHGANLVLFVGGDGTARDVQGALADDPLHLALGIPAGVKMQSAVFARSPEEAAAIVSDWLDSPGKVSAMEVADIDEDARRRGILASKLHGYLNVPDTRRGLQGGKVGSSVALESLAGLASEAYSKIDPEAMCILGPGQTVQALSHLLDGESSLLGVDLAHRGRIIGTDLSAEELHQRTAGHRVQLVVSPIGGQGFLFGRGNQQLDVAILSRIERDDLIILCSSAKLAKLGGGPLYIDVPNLKNSQVFTGYQRVICGPQQTASIRVADASTLSA